MPSLWGDGESKEEHSSSWRRDPDMEILLGEAIRPKTKGRGSTRREPHLPGSQIDQPKERR